MVLLKNIIGRSAVSLTSHVKGPSPACSCFLYRNVETTQHITSRTSSRLVEVGKLQVPKLQGKYESGQLFLHEIFGYRGVILFPWVAKVYDRDDTKALSYPSGRHGKDVVGKTHTYYQTLMDSRDSADINTQTESVTFLGSPDSGEKLCSIPGLDYVSHENIVPYMTSDQNPIQNDLFEKFFIYDKDSDPAWIAEDTLRSWQRLNHPWLELSEVHRQTTNNIRVTVTPFYMGNREAHSSRVYWWRYIVRIENLGKETVQLRERHWRIFSLSGTLETVRGRGVVGKEPVLSSQQPAFQYSSVLSLQAPSGHMWGVFKMEKEDGSTFECKIPPCSLESKVDE
ncbi:polymerase delta-interacting protein 2-like [Watersipora subatra]|uniref:polymerase delta-interacting protein 2-like n=1 Tax=Watersipora subatra TaxID=2589382 RepID=UPI00355BEFE8